MELRIISPNEDGFLQTIEFNHEEIKKELAVRLEKYKGLVYDEKEVKVAKSDRATLNKFKQAIESKRMEIKKQCLTPYETFEVKIKEILALVDKPIQEIDSQVKKFEADKAAEKKKTIEGIYEKCIGDLKPLLPLSKMWDEKWLNVTVKLSTISEVILKTVDTVRSDLATITDLKSEFETEIKQRYLDTLLLSEALAMKTILEDKKKKLEEYRKKSVSVKAEEVKLPCQQPTLDEVAEYTQIITPELEMIEFRLWVTPEQKEFLRNYILQNKIKFGKVR